MPGVSTGQGNDAFDARVNGGLQSGDEASVDGVSMQQGFMSQGGMVSILKDFPMSPDMVSEIKVLTSGYAPEYGSSTGGQIMAVTKSGGASFHGSGFEYNQDASMNAVAWGKTPAPFKKNNFGFNIGGPIAVPGLTSDKLKSFFYFDHERYRQKGGSSSDVALDPVDAGARGRLHGLARRQRQPDPDLRPGDAAVGWPRRVHQGSVHGVRRQARPT